MLHLVPVRELDESPEPYAEALSRLASIRHALRLVDSFAGGPASDPEDDGSDDGRMAASWTEASKSKSRCFDRRTAGTASAASAGLEAILAERAAGRDPHSAAGHQVAEAIRLGLDDVSRLMRRS